MATIREYFDTDPRALTVHSDWKYTTREGQELGEVRAKIAYEFEANARFWYFYIPPEMDPMEATATLLRTDEVMACRLKSEGDGVYVEIGHSDYTERQNTDTLVFTNRIHLYADAELTAEQRTSLNQFASTQGLFLSVRDREYARKRSESEKPLAFISHDSGDKDALVRNLALELIKLHCPVWYDEYSLKVGDSLRSSIETGMKNAKKCVLVLSPRFLANEGWGRAEFDSVFTREILEKENVILPVWHGVGVKEVYEYSPRLADKVGLASTLGVEELAKKLASAIKQEI